MKSLLKRDNYIFGAIIAVVLPVVMFFLLHWLNNLVISIFSAANYIDDANILMLSIFLNLIAMRYYLVNLKYDKTGRGILLITFLEGFVYFFLVVRLNWQGF